MYLRYSSYQLAFAVLYVLSINTNLIDGLFHKCTKEVPTITLPRDTQTVSRGNGSTPYLSVIQVCCEGYKEYQYNRSKCIPDCSDTCDNGFCIATNVCQCHPYHVKNIKGKCVSTCPIGCENGQCHWNGTCTCNAGYALDASGRICVPICPGGCKNGKVCISPGVCSCKEGYVPSNNDTCIHSCSKDCGKGGVCVGVNLCSCLDGYVLKDGICQAKCWQNCDNGLCLETNACVCNKGYIYDPVTTRCIPSCDICINGVCTEPNICKCFGGYSGTNGTCLPVCRRGCGNGECVDPGICKCNAGYQINSYGICATPHSMQFLNPWNMMHL